MSMSKHFPAFLAKITVPAAMLLGMMPPWQTVLAQDYSNGGLFGGRSSPPSYSRSSPNYGWPSSTNYNLSYDWGSWSNGYASEKYSSSRFRTLCVRTCDGYYFPISFSTSRSGLARDAKQCEASCGVPAKLFYHRNPGTDLQHMVDLQGRPYAAMEYAFRYREELVKNCRCNPEPWSEAAKREYQRRAEAAANPAQPGTAAAESPVLQEAVAHAEVAGWRSADPDQIQTRPTPRRRSRYIASDPSIDGRWWAGRW